MHLSKELQNQKVFIYPTSIFDISSSGLLFHLSKDIKNTDLVSNNKKNPSEHNRKNDGTHDLKRNY